MLFVAVVIVAVVRRPRAAPAARAVRAERPDCDDGRPPDADARACASLFARMALAAAALTFVVIVASAFMRHTQAGLACADWPACYGRIAASPARDAAPSTGVRVARIAHRLAATGVLALVIGLLLVAWTQKPAWKREGASRWRRSSSPPRSPCSASRRRARGLPAVTLGNLLGGYLMLALLAATAAAARDVRGDRAAGASRRAPLRAGRAGDRARAFVQAASGGLIGAQYALTACPTLAGCPHLLVRRAWSRASALDPLRELSIVDGRVVPPAGAAGLHVIHRALGIAVAIATLVLAFGLRSRRAAPRRCWPRSRSPRRSPVPPRSSPCRRCR